jgi:hypothetical protein
MRGWFSASRNLAERMSRSRVRLPVLKDGASRVAITVAGGAGSMVISPETTCIVPDTAPRPNRCRVRKVTDERPGSGNSPGNRTWARG